MLPNDPQRTIRDAAEAIAPQLIMLRRDIHRVPELAFEARTAGIVAAELTRLGIAHRTGLGVTGVVGEIRAVGRSHARDSRRYGCAADP